MSLLLLVLLPFVGSAVAAVLPTNARNLESLWAALVMLAVAVPLALLYPSVEAGQVLTERLSWLPTLGVDVVVRLDGFAWMFAMLVSGMGLLVVIYARYYLSPEDPAARFYSLLLGFMGAMLGVVVSGNRLRAGWLCWRGCCCWATSSAASSSNACCRRVTWFVRMRCTR